jgi:branched-chain amino acid transport system ATP-binding protein
MTAPVLELDALEVRHGAVHAVRGLSLTVDRGEIVGLIGPNGAGKSSTLHAVMGVVAVAGGDVRLHGRSLAGRSPEDVARAGVALVPEGRRIFAELTVEENLRLGTAARGSGGLERAYELFPVVAEFRKRPAGALSGGQQQQLAIARALVAQPEVLLLDEPSLGLAPRVVDVVFETLQQIRERGIAILLVEHDVSLVMRVCSSIYVLDFGELVFTGTPAEVAASDVVRAAYLGDHAAAIDAVATRA